MNGSPEIANSPRQDKPPESRLSFYLLRLQCIQSMQNSIDKSANKYQTNTKQISNKCHICTVSAEFEGDYLCISCGHTLCNLSSGCKLILTKINTKQISWKVKLIYWLKFFFGLIDANRGNIYLLSFIFLQFHQKKNTMHQVVVSNGKKMIQAQFISS